MGSPTFGQFQCGTGPNAETNNNEAGIVSSARTLQGNFRIVVLIRPIADGPYHPALLL